MGIGGIAAVILGAVADAPVDLRLALTVSVIAPALGVFVCFQLPAPARPASRAPQPTQPVALTAD